MKEKEIKNSQAGFTLIEVVVVLGIVAIILSAGLFLTLDSYKSSSFRSERDVVVSALQKARSQAINNICLGGSCTGGLPHGVHFEPGKYVVFQGQSYSESDWANDVMGQGYSITVTSGSISEFDVIFRQLRGDASPHDITLTDQQTGRSSVININSEGRIDWTN